MESITMLRSYLEIGFTVTFALAMLTGMVWLGCKLAPLLLAFFRKYIDLADTLKSHFERSANLQEELAMLHKGHNAPCNTLPLRKAGIAAADALEEIGDKIGADVVKTTQKMRDALAINGAGG